MEIVQTQTVLPNGYTGICGYIEINEEMQFVSNSELIPNKDHVLSMYIKADGTKKMTMFEGYSDENVPEADVTTEWNKAILKFTSNGEKVIFNLPKGKYYIYQVMLEEGTVPSTWQQSDMDVQEDYTARITESYNKIMLEVSKKADGEEVASKFEQTAEQISAKVTKGASYNGFTINDEGVDISGDGAFTINMSNIKLDKDGALTLPYYLTDESSNLLMESVKLYTGNLSDFNDNGGSCALVPITKTAFNALAIYLENGNGEYNRSDVSTVLKAPIQLWNDYKSPENPNTDSPLGGKTLIYSFDVEFDNNLDNLKGANTNLLHQIKLTRVKSGAQVPTRIEASSTDLGYLKVMGYENGNLINAINNGFIEANTTYRVYTEPFNIPENEAGTGVGGLFIEKAKYKDASTQLPTVMISKPKVEIVGKKTNPSAWDLNKNEIPEPNEFDNIKVGLIYNKSGKNFFLENRATPTIGIAGTIQANSSKTIPINNFPYGRYLMSFYSSFGARPDTVLGDYRKMSIFGFEETEENCANTVVGLAIPGAQDTYLEKHMIVRLDELHQSFSIKLSHNSNASVDAKFGFMYVYLGA